VQSIDFHYDLDSHSSLNVYFYLTDTDHMTGAPSVMRGSQRRKPLRLLLATRSQPDQVIEEC